MRGLLILTVAVVPAACVGPPSPPPSPAPRATQAGPASPPRPSPPTSVATGTWSYAQDGRGSVAMFGVPGRDAAFVLRCMRDGRRVFASVPGSNGGTITLRATTMTRAYPAAPTQGAPSYVAAELTASDPLLDALAYSRGSITVGSGTADAMLPAWPEIARVIEDCRG